jgi:uncharacterized repeat protein (TIGR03833 family)
MNRPRNRQSRPQRQNHGARVARRGGSQDTTAFSQNVPNTQQVGVGAFVSIVLKVDQPTGREVQGVVADVLTSGNHPRGIKVRLTDGRVGRVQRIATGEEAGGGSAGLIDMGRNGDALNYRDLVSSSASLRPRSRHNECAEEEQREPASGYSLEDFLPVGHPLRDSPAHTPTPPPHPPATESASQLCPVCSQFEGDEVAVSHHVATHFD